jgi:hypothetical protein
VAAIPDRFTDADESGLQTVTFYLRRRAEHAYVLISRPDFALLTQLEEDSDEEWSVTLRLAPGVYRFRYYVNSDGVTTYCSPSESHTDIEMQGLDGLL